MIPHGHVSVTRSFTSKLFQSKSPIFATQTYHPQSIFMFVIFHNKLPRVTISNPFICVSALNWQSLPELICSHLYFYLLLSTYNLICICILFTIYFTKRGKISKILQSRPHLMKAFFQGILRTLFFN